MSKADKIFTTIDIILTLVFLAVVIGTGGIAFLFGQLAAIFLGSYIIGAIYVRITKLYKEHGQKAYNKAFMRIYPFATALVLIGTLS